MRGRARDRAPAGAAGYDVLAVREAAAGAGDADVLDVAVREGRVLITEDTDFGELAVRHGRPAHGIVLLRDPAAMPAEDAARLLDLIRREGDRLHRLLAVIDRSRIRIRALR